MEPRRLAETPRLLGAIGIGGAGALDERVLAAAFEAGVTLVDAGPSDSDREAAAGAAIRGLRARDHAVLMVEVPAAARRGRAVQESVERSLRATRLEALPLAMIGGVDDALRGSAAWAELRDATGRMVREGKVLRWGASVRSPDDAKGIVDEPGLVALQLSLNLWSREGSELAIAASDRDLAVIACRALGGGVLAGERATPAEAERLARWSRVVRRVPLAALSTEAARRIAADSDLRRPPSDRLEADTIGELALRWLLGFPGTTALVGVSSVDHLHDALRSADGRTLTPALRAILDDLLASDD